MNSQRIEQRFAELRTDKRTALVTYLCAGDPDYSTSLALLQGLPQAGADLIELGIPFSDPMADGPTIQAATQRALQAGQSLARTLALVRDFRRNDQHTPLVLMGYYNPIYRFGAEAFIAAAADAGVDGLLIVDLPAEHDQELGPLARAAGIRMIRMTTPGTDAQRLPRLLEQAEGFIYHVALNGVTGVGQADSASVAASLARIRQHTALPLCVGFGVRQPAQAAALAQLAEGVVVGSALVERLQEQGVDAALALVRELAAALRP